MEKLFRILKRTGILLLGMAGLVAVTYVVYDNFFYKKELNQIKRQLNKIEHVEVINIWGHKDVTLEEISARLRIKDKGEVVLYGLSKDVFHYPRKVFVSEIGGYSFTWFSCDGKIDYNINIGQGSELGKRIGFQFNSVNDVVENYDNILKAIEELKQLPDLNHFVSPDTEAFLSVEKKSTNDQDPLYHLLGIEDAFEFARTLEWTREDCYYTM